jgi:hypothetical protein
MNQVGLTDAGDWTEVRLPWSYFTQPGWVASPVKRDITKVTGISWYTERAAGTSGEYWVKDVYCLGYGEPLSVRPGSPSSYNNKAASFVKMSGKALQLRFAQGGSVDIFDLKGVRIRSMKLKQGDHTIKMGGLPKGMYIIKANSGNWNQSIKMLVR